MTGSTRLGADLVDWIGYSTRSNGTARLQARHYLSSRELTARIVPAIRQPRGTVADRCRPQAINKSYRGFAAEKGAPQDVVRSRKPRGGNAAGAIGTVSAFLFHITIRKLGKRDQQAWPNFFTSVGFSYWETNGQQCRLGENQQGSSLSGRLTARAASRALNYYRSWL